MLKRCQNIEILFLLFLDRHPYGGPLILPRHKTLKIVEAISLSFVLFLCDDSLLRQFTTILIIIKGNWGLPRVTKGYQGLTQVNSG